jgi:hypothetical protein
MSTYRVILQTTLIDAAGNVISSKISGGEFILYKNDGEVVADDKANEYATDELHTGHFAAEAGFGGCVQGKIDFCNF